MHTVCVYLNMQYVYTIHLVLMYVCIRTCTVHVLHTYACIQTCTVHVLHTYACIQTCTVHVLHTYACIQTCIVHVCVSENRFCLRKNVLRDQIKEHGHIHSHGSCSQTSCNVEIGKLYQSNHLNVHDPKIFN